MSGESFDPFFKRQFPQLVRFLLHLGAGRAEAEDLAQDAMTAAYQRWDRAELQAPDSWIRKVAYHAYCHAVGRRRLGAELAARADWAREEAHHDDDLPLLGEMQRRVMRALRELPRRQREAMAWTMDGFKPSEIATFTNQEAATIRSNLRFARMRLSERLEGDDRGDHDAGGAA